MHEEQLLQLLKEKDLAAFAQLIDENKPLVERIAFQYGIEPESVSNAVQETFLNIYRKIERLEAGKLSVWIYQITIQTLRGYQKRITSKNEDIAIISKRYGYYIENRRHILIHTCLRFLDSKYKEPLILHYFYNKSIEEISAILKASVDSVLMKLERGEVLLKEKYEKAIHHELQIKDYEKEMIEQLRELNYDYERLPAFVDKQDILLSIEKIKTSNKWKKVIPTGVGIIGLIIFSIFTVTYIQGENERQAFQEQQEALEQQKEDVIDPEDKQVELDPEIVEYLEEAKETLANELGIEDINNFTSVQTLEMILKSIIQHNPGNEAFVTDHQKEYIDMTLTPPSIAKKDLLNPDKRDEKIMTYLYTLASFESNFQDYLDSLLLEFSVPIDEYDVIVSYQDDVANYDGPEKIKEFMETLNQQGYYLTRKSENDKVTVVSDFVQAKDNVALAGFNEGYLRYLDFTIKYDYQFNTKGWKEHDEILLELESILTNYDYTETFKQLIITDINTNLHSFFQGNPGPRPLLEEDRQVFYQFLENNRDSIFWDIINTAVVEYEANDWMETIVPPDPTFIKILFDERFGEVKLENFDYAIRLPRPLITNSVVIYKDLKEDFDQSQLLELSPVEMVSLYDYASGKDDNEVFNALMTLNGVRDNLDVNWDLDEIRHSSEYVFTEYPSENNAIVHLADWGLEHVTSIELVKDNNIWKLAWFYKNSSSNGG